MKNLDNEIKNIFAEKLANHESPVSADMWNAVQAKMTAQAAVSGASAAAVKAGVSKLWWAAALAAATVVGTLVYFAIQPDAKPAKATEQMPAPTVKTEKLDSQLEQNAAGTERNEIISETVKATDNTSSAGLPKETGTAVTTTAEVKTNNSNTSNNIPTPPEVSEFEKGSANSDKSGENGNTQPINGGGQTISQEKVTANFKAVLVSQSDLKFSFVPQADKAAKYEWNFGDGETSAEKAPAHTYTQEGNYSVELTVTDRNGNVQSLNTQVSAMRPAELFIPNVFTPNGDGKNDEFVIELKNGSGILTKIIILNSTGRIFESDGSSMWNGKLPDGELAPAGTYTYLVRAVGNNQDTIEKSGSITLRR